MENDIVTPIEYYRIVRSQIEHEDNLISQRISWFVTAQSFLFTAYALVTNISPENLTKPMSSTRMLSTILPLVGFMTGIIIYPTIIAGMMAMTHLRDCFNRHPAAEKLRGNVPAIHGLKGSMLLGHLGPVLIPLLFMAVWLYVVFKN